MPLAFLPVLLLLASEPSAGSFLADSPPDWLVARDDDHARSRAWTSSSEDTAAKVVTLDNGLLKRVFTTSPGWGTIDLAGAEAGDSALRTVLPEASLTIGGVEYFLGGLYLTDDPDEPTGPQFTGQHAYLNRSRIPGGLAVRPHVSWRYAEHWTGSPSPVLPWTPGRRHSPADAVWPPRGMRLSVRFTPPIDVVDAAVAATLAQLNVTLVYELYDGAPLMAKWVEVTHMGGPSPPPPPVLIEAMSTEIVAVNCEFSSYGTKGNDHYVHGRLHVTTTAAHGSATTFVVGVNATNDPGACEEVLNVSYAPSLGVVVGAPGVVWPGAAGAHPDAPPALRRAHAALTTGHFTSFRTMILLHDSFDPERQMLGRHQVFRRLAPWVQENPLQLHLTNSTAEAFSLALEQMHKVGFEALVLSFGSGFDFELSPDDPKIAALAESVAQATALGIEVGGYDLTVLDRGHGGYGGNVGDQWDRVDPVTRALSADACYASGWRDKLEAMLYGVTAKANLSIVLTDGPYGGGACAATNHTHHLGQVDSVYQQYRLQAEFYRTLFRAGKFIRQPDAYFFDGGNHAPLGYNEQQYSLPRWTDLTVSRQGFLDDVYARPAVLGWMFLPMKPYHAGGDGASFEPFDEHLQEYGFALSQYLGAGCGMTYRGDKLYDQEGDASFELVKAKVAWFKAHRDIITAGDILHVRRYEVLVLS